MTQNSIEDRDVLLEELLALLPEDARPKARRPSRKLVGVAVLALALGATGGAISATALAASPETAHYLPDDEDVPESVGDPQLDASIWVAVALANSIATQKGREFVGTPYTIVGDSESTAHLIRPYGSSELAFSIACAAPGTFAVAIDGSTVGTLTCTDNPDDPNSAGQWVRLPEGEHEVTVTGTDRFALWASWIS